MSCPSRTYRVNILYAYIMLYELISPSTIIYDIKNKWGVSRTAFQYIWNRRVHIDCVW